ncbi:MAG TPA: DEAD/DEAH box helicase, partial [Pyrinomonadaceae bacterium]|nr:DEAD/DEAH box helicase [Pyrinomonadaceae bacterium]
MQQRSESSRKDSPIDNQPNTAEPIQPQYAEVAVPLYVFNTFIYRLPEPMRITAAPGSRIVVPLSRKLITGYIVNLLDRLPPETNLKNSDIREAQEILDLVPLVTPQLLQLTKWVSDYYLSPWGEVIKAALPPGISPDIEVFLSLTGVGQRKLVDQSSTDDKSTQLLHSLSQTDETSFAEVSDRFGSADAAKLVRELEREGFLEIRQRTGSNFVKTKYQRRARLVEPLEAPMDQRRKLTEPQSRVIQVLTGVDSLALPDLLTAACVGMSSVTTLQKRNVIEIFEEQLRRDPLRNASLPPVEDYVLTQGQRGILAEIEQPLRTRNYLPFLLHGVTGSGKTEVYIRAMRVALELGRSAMMLVPEIALTPVFSRRLRQHFGDNVAIFHSSLSKGERFDEWTRVRRGEARIVIGTRSAVFAPIKDLGLVIVDEEHESTYRQQDSP